MTTERRTHARGKQTLRVTFTDATSDKPSEGTLRDIGRGGIFIVTDVKLAAGKRIEFEVHVTPTPIAGMGRVIWVREQDHGDLPAGLGIKFIDVDNDALIAIDRLVGLKTNVRERTMLGLARPIDLPKVETKAEVAPVAPKVEVPKVEAPKIEPPRPAIKPSRERTVLGLAPPAGPPREKELSWPDEPPAAPPEAPAPPEPPPPPPAPVVEAIALPPEPIALVPEQAAPTPEPAPPPDLELPVADAREPAPPPTPAPEKEPSEAPVPRELPGRESGSRSWIAAVFLLVVVGVAVYLYWGTIVAFVAPRGPVPVPPTISAPPKASESAAPTTSASATASSAPTMLDGGETESLADSGVSLVAGDAALREGHDGGHDGGHHHDGGAHVHATHVHGVPTIPTTTAADNPY